MKVPSLNVVTSYFPTAWHLVQGDEAGEKHTRYEAYIGDTYIELRFKSLSALAIIGNECAVDAGPEFNATQFFVMVDHALRDHQLRLARNLAKLIEFQCLIGAKS